jgi:hypothetical protein
MLAPPTSRLLTLQTHTIVLNSQVTSIYTRGVRPTIVESKSGLRCLASMPDASIRSSGVVRKRGQATFRLED